jgi:tetratricopeptide (TPR) repeat protein
LLLTAVGSPAVKAQAVIESSPSPSPLDTAFSQMYATDFVGARKTVQDFQKRYPDDPMGPTAEAASYLFEEFNRQGVLTSAFFLDNKRLLGGVNGPADPALSTGFLASVGRTRQLTSSQLAAHPTDTRALLALTMCAGMQSDYESLIDKKPLASLHYLREAQDNAGKLLAADPGAGDAYVATGVADYIIGCMPAYKRAFLWMGGIHGDRPRGMEEVRKATEQAHYLKPFAQLLLALASLREGQPEEARDLYAQLVREFPENPLFPHELVIATTRARAAKACHPSTTC